MKKTLLIHGIWLFISIGALAVGSKVFPAKVKNPTENGNQPQRAVTVQGRPGSSVEASTTLDAEAEANQKELIRLSNGASPKRFVEAFLKMKPA